MSRTRHFLAVLCSLILISSQAIGQQASPPAVSASALLQQSLAAQIGNTRISDVTLIGSARLIAGSDGESGTVTLKVLSSGATRLDFNFPSGPRSEFRSALADDPSGGWSGPDGVVHPIAVHNLMNDWAWFPLFSPSVGLDTQKSVVSLIGSENRNEKPVLHLTISREIATRMTPPMGSKRQPMTPRAAQSKSLIRTTRFRKHFTALPLVARA